MSKIKLSIILVHYDQEEIILRSIAEIISQKIESKCELIVVDNDENSSLKKRIPKNVLYIKSPRNLGYGGGNNLGASYAKGKYLLILNPDVSLHKSSIDRLVEFLDKNKKVAAVSPILMNEKYTGTKELTPIRAIFSHSFINKVFPNNFIVRDYKSTNFDKIVPYQVETLPGSVFMIRRRVFLEVGKFDERIFLYYEESDIGKKIKEANYLMYVLPNAKAKHKQTRKENKKLLIENIKSRQYYIKKHYGYFWMFIVEVFCRFSKWHFLLLIILILLLSLRISRFSN